MERPDTETNEIGKLILEPAAQFRCVGRTQDLEEANRIAGRYQLQGFETKIVTKSRSGIALYEIWVSKEPDILSTNDREGRV